LKCWFEFLSSLTGLDFVLADDDPAINGWAIVKCMHSLAAFNKQMSAWSIFENSPALQRRIKRPTSSKIAQP